MHHLWFDENDYVTYGNLFKWNPAIKSASYKAALWEALLSDKIDVVATDHAPHTLQEKDHSYFKAPSGGPLVQHSLTAMLVMSKNGMISLEKVIEKCVMHRPTCSVSTVVVTFAKDIMPTLRWLIPLKHEWFLIKIFCINAGGRPSMELNSRTR